jgi:acyl-coenzyme A thioesterase PaaI-like protein
MLRRFPLLAATLRLRFLGWTRIPLLASVRPRVVALDAGRCEVRIPLRRWTRNHLGSMYFGALAIGADCAGGLLAAECIRIRGVPVSLVFKAFRADFLKRPEGDVFFVCEGGGALASGERVTEPVHVRAEVRPPGGSPEIVAEFTLELSLKRGGRLLG